VKKVVVLFSGAGSNLAWLAEHLPSEGIIIAAAVTNNPEAGGIAVARSSGIPVEVLDHRTFASREAYDAELAAVVTSYRPDVTVLAGFMRVLTPVFTDRVRAINLHPSLLPRHKGLDAIGRSWEDAHPEGGVSVHWVTGELDGGAIILQCVVPKAGLDRTAYEQRIRRLEKRVLLEGILAVLDTE